MTTEASALGQLDDVTSSVAGLPVFSSSSSDDGECAQRSPSAPSSFEAIYEAHFDFVWRMARRLGIPEASAEDVVQDAFLVLHRKLDEYDGTTPVKRWLVGIVLRVVSDHRRRFRRKEAACVPHAADSNGDLLLASNEPSPSTEVENAQGMRLLESLLEELDEGKREVLVLAELEEMTAREIAEMLGVNINTIYARLRAARQDFDAAHARYRARLARRQP